MISFSEWPKFFHLTKSVRRGRQVFLSMYFHGQNGMDLLIIEARPSMSPKSQKRVSRGPGGPESREEPNSNHQVNGPFLTLFGPSRLFSDFCAILRMNFRREVAACDCECMEAAVCARPSFHKSIKSVRMGLFPSGRIMRGERSYRPPKNTPKFKVAKK